MVTDRDTVVAALRSSGDHDRAHYAACALPPLVDTEKDAGVLAGLGLSPAALVALPPAAPPGG